MIRLLERVPQELEGELGRRGDEAIRHWREKVAAQVDLAEVVCLRLAKEDVSLRYEFDSDELDVEFDEALSHMKLVKDVLCKMDSADVYVTSK